jgi:opacity protein-like surface antigen
MGGDWTGFYGGAQLGYGQLTADPLTEDPDGLTFGLHGGYLYDLGTWVVGGEVDFDGSNIEDATADVALDSVVRAKLRLGYDGGNWMPYLTGGIAQATTSGAVDGSDTGSFGGVGLDYQLSNNMRIGGEILQHQFEDFDGNGFDIDATTASARVSFSF